jgi:hypothetical protein
MSRRAELIGRLGDLFETPIDPLIRHEARINHQRVRSFVLVSDYGCG